MTTYPLTFPAQAPAEESLRIASQQAAMESPHTFAQTTINKADHWLLEFVWPRMTHEEADRVQAWIDQLQGQVGTFLYAPRNASKTPLPNRTLAASASPYSTIVSVAGWAANAASNVKPGQYVQIGQRLHRVTIAPANADGQGRCLLEVRPMIRSTMEAGTTVDFDTPEGEFRLTTSDGYAYRLDPDRVPSFPAISAKEAL